MKLHRFFDNTTCNCTGTNCNLFASWILEVNKMFTPLCYQCLSRFKEYELSKLPGK